ncbi:MAG: hypothetical protein A3K18_30815 [Lentisphaerae bacterium RIFOXYA12_64_32]|nr:MAG: hypothetical protein A3K18_30815 [Lentisphaerae bacterium RIFOXYA12_64_32]
MAVAWLCLSPFGLVQGQERAAAPQGGADTAAPAVPQPANAAAPAPAAPPAEAVAAPVAESTVAADPVQPAAATETAGAAAAETAPSRLSFKADDLEIGSALALFAELNNLNIVADPDVTGKVTVAVNNLPLEKVLDALLAAHGYYWEKDDGGLIRVHSMETRTFSLDYVRLVRSSEGQSDVKVSSSNSNSSGNSGTNSNSSGVSSGADKAATMTITQKSGKDDIGFWDEVETQLKILVPDGSDGRVMVDPMSGTIQVYARHPIVEQAASFIYALDRTIHRQVDIEAKIYEVTLNSMHELGIDWPTVISKVGVSMTGNKNTGDYDSTATGNYVVGTLRNGDIEMASQALQLILTPDNARATLDALAQQGTLNVVSKPRLRTLNNQSALIKVGTDMPFFSQTFLNTSTGSNSTTNSGDIVQIITVGTVLSLTPQISADGWITLDVSPVVTSLGSTPDAPDGTATSPSRTATAPVLDIKQTSTLVRVRDGETVVIGGLIMDYKREDTRGVPGLGKIPYLGRLFRWEGEITQKKELVIFLTPQIVK